MIRAVDCSVTRDADGISCVCEMRFGRADMAEMHLGLSDIRSSMDCRLTDVEAPVYR